MEQIATLRIRDDWRRFAHRTTRWTSKPKVPSRTIGTWREGTFGMALTTKLELRQSQQLVMTPQLQQAIRLLQLSNLELSDFVETELERNPLLERDAETRPRRRSESATEPAEMAQRRRPIPTARRPAVEPPPRRHRRHPISTVDPDAFREASASDLGVADRGRSVAARPTVAAASIDDDTNLEDYVADARRCATIFGQLQLAIVGPRRAADRPLT